MIEKLLFVLIAVTTTLHIIDCIIFILRSLSHDVFNDIIGLLADVSAGAMLYALLSSRERIDECVYFFSVMSEQRFDLK